MRPRAIALSIVAIAVAAALYACAPLDWVGKHAHPDNPPGPEEGRVYHGGGEPFFDKGSARSKPALDAKPATVDFGRQPIGSGTVKILSLSNPSRFDYRIVEAALSDRAFTLVDVPSPLVVAAQGRTMLAIMFRPEAPRNYSGRLRLTIDSIEGGLLQIALEGKGK